jgi:hypothetical protein
MVDHTLADKRRHFERGSPIVAISLAETIHRSARIDPLVQLNLNSQAFDPLIATRKTRPGTAGF